MLQGAQTQKIGIIGGSIAGLAVGIKLREHGYQVTILERSLHPHQGRGAGITMPGSLVEKCIELNLFDADIPRIPTSSRSFCIRDPHFSHQTRTIWTQPLFLTPFNWSDIYSNLLKRFPAEHYLRGQHVTAVHQAENGCYVQTSNAEVHHFDRIIAADGVGSIVRKALFPQTTLQYANYIGWRGIIDDPLIVNNELFNSHVPCFMFSNGHLLMYRIPAPDYKETGRTLLNWLMYECDNGKVSLIDKAGTKRDISIPPGMLSDSQIRQLHSLAYNVLPLPIAATVCKTSEPFMQAIFDYQAPTYVVDRICLLGDAADTKRPHSVSGLSSALESAISLAAAMDPHVGDIEKSLKRWSDAQLLAAEKQGALAKLMGRALVTEPPHWEIMDQTSTSDWWNNLMQGKSWHAIDPKTAETKKSFTPLSDTKLQNAAKDMTEPPLARRRSKL